MSTDVTDDAKRAAIQRLTMAERECLKRCLDHQTAKQMALDLGVSPHAVEKRLKMARAKLGLSSSLEAAKLVHSFEQSGRLGPDLPDLSRSEPRSDQAGSVATSLAETAGKARRHRPYLLAGVTLMIFAAVIAMIVGVPTTRPVAGQASPSSTSSAATGAVPAAGTEAALRRLIAGLATGAPDYAKLAPPFAEVVRRDLPMTHPLFKSLGELKSITFRGRGLMGDDGYDLVFANGKVLMSVALDAEGRMAGGILRPEEGVPGR